MLRTIFIVFFALIAMTAVAALPDAVLDACLAPEVTEHATGQSWTILTRKAWDNGLLEVSENAGVTTIRCVGKDHPQGWVTTEVKAVAPNPTEAQPTPMQVLTILATPKGVVPRMTLDITLIKQAKLPPFTIQPWGNRIALVADAKDWYIIAEHPNAKMTQAKTPDKAVTLKVINLVAEGAETVSASIKIGEGPLPPSQITK